MKSSLLFLGQVLCATSILALPAPGQLLDHHISQKRATSDWAGAILTGPLVANQNFTSVGGSWTIPSVSAPSTSAGSYSTAQWIGMDGYNYTAASLKVGTLETVTIADDGSASTTVQAWYQWYPAALKILDLDLVAGNKVDVSIIMVANEVMTSGQVFVEQASTELSAQVQVTGAAIPGQSVEWVVEGLDATGGAATLADFGSVSFTDCTALATYGTPYNVGTASFVSLDEATASGVSDQDFSVVYS